MRDITFVCDFSSRKGYGHLSRCIKIAQLINPKFQLAFKIHTDDKVDKIILEQIQNVEIISKEDNSNSKLTIYDCMDSDDDPEYIDIKRLNKEMHLCKKLILLANGYNLPKVPAEVIIIGFRGNNKSNFKNIFWGNKYISIDTKNKYLEVKPDKNNIFIRLGGNINIKYYKILINSLYKIDKSYKINILLPPIGDNLKSLKNIYKNINFLKNVSNIYKLIRKSEIVICSYGHLCYEAISLGAAVCVVGVKNFQIKYSNYLMDQNLIVFAGIINNITEESIMLNIKKTINKSEVLKRNGINKIDGNGLNRITRIIENNL